MSAWEGSARQEGWGRARLEREAEVARIQKESPWLSPEDCRAWQQRQEEARRPPPKCCPCMGRGPGIVRHVIQSAIPTDPAYSLGPCKCACHKPRPRGEAA